MEKHIWKKIIVVVLLLSLLVSSIPVSAAQDKYDKLTKECAVRYEKRGYQQKYWKANKSKFMKLMNQVFREVQGLNNDEWKAFSSGVMRGVEEGAIFTKGDNPEKAARDFYNYGWFGLEDYWTYKDNSNWNYDPNQDYSEEVIRVLTDALKKTKAEGYAVSDEIINTLPAQCAELINSFDLAPQELKYMLYELRRQILFRKPYIDEKDILESIDELLDEVNIVYEGDIVRDIRLYRTVRKIKFVGSQPSEGAKIDIGLAITSGIVPKELQSNYQKAVTREEYVSLLVNTIFQMELKRKSFYNMVTGEDLAISKEKYLSTVTATDYISQKNDNEDIKLAYMMGFINETSYSAFKPDALITRQEAAAIVGNYYQSTLYFDLGAIKSIKKLTDLNKAATWAREFIALCYWDNSFYIFPERDGKVKPLANITREQAIITAYSMYKTSTPLFVRGNVAYQPWIDYSISKNSITAVGLNSDFDISRHKVGTENLLKDEEFKEISSAETPEQITAMILGNFSLPTLLTEKMSMKTLLSCYLLYAPGGGAISSPSYPEEFCNTFYDGKNHEFDLGWAKLEINGNGFIQKYTLKNNGFHNFYYYGGLKCKELIYKVIR